jgi:hypothetical protein
VPQDCIDHEARAKIDVMKVQSDERWSNVGVQVAALNKSVDRLVGYIIGAIFAFIALLVSVVGVLFVRAIGWVK